MKTPSKGELLEKYASHAVSTFIQYDAFTKAEADPNTHPDKDGDALFGGHVTHELMIGSNVRVLIHPATPAADVLRVLGKIAACIERNRTERKAAIAERDLTAGEVAGIREELPEHQLPF
jgi:hypothetical protein